MMNKEKKSRKELESIVMNGVREIPDTDDIVGVAIISSVQIAPHHRNWDAAFTVHGNRVAPEAAFRLVRELGAKFDLI